MPGELGLDAIRALLDEGAQLVDVLPPPEYEEEHLPGGGQYPAEIAGREDHPTAGPWPPRHRLLLGLPVRHEPTSRVAARATWVRAGLRLLGREGRLACHGMAAGGNRRRRPERGRGGSKRNSDVLAR